MTFSDTAFRGASDGHEIHLGRATRDARDRCDRRMFLRFAVMTGGSVILGAPGLFGVCGSLCPRPREALATEETIAALSSAQAAYDEAIAQLSYLGQQAEEAQYALSQTQAQLDETNAAIIDMQASIEQKQAELSAAQDVLADRIAANYKAGKGDAISVLLDASSFDDLVTRVYYAGKVSDSDAEAIDTVKALKAELQQQESDLQAKKSEQEELAAQQQAETDDLEAQVAAMNDYVDSLSSEVQSLLAQKSAEEAAAAEAQRQQLEAQLAAQAAASDSSSQQQTDNAATDSGGASLTDDDSSDGGSSDVGGGGSSSSGGTGNHASGVASVAWNYIGVPYVWGGTDPSGFDCSGLAQYCYAMCGYSIARDTYGQIAQIQSLGNWKSSMSELQPGDLVFPHSGHVGIYEGDGMMIHAPTPGQTVCYASVYAFMGGGSPI